MKVLEFLKDTGRQAVSAAVFSLAATAAQAAVCNNPNLDVVVLGSGGPELDDRRASVGYLLRENGKARILVDFGSGTSLNFERAGAKIEDLQAVLLSQFHVDHANDVPALVKGSFFSDRSRDLPVYGPSGNKTVPGLNQYLKRLFGADGAYSYLSGFLDGSESFRLKPVTVSADTAKPTVFSASEGGFRISAVPVTHSIIPALGWRVEKDGCAVVFSSGTSNMGRTLDKITSGANVFVAHNAIPEGSTDRIALRLHMPPSEIGRIAGQSGVRNVVLSHFMNRTEHVQPATAQAIRSRYAGALAFAQDCDIYSVQSGKKTGSCAK
ncbi:MBL fold metallo-hydrolase [Neisseria chenwenguii]|uniref:MBL fold metallo-hydrolase n=1 Tax=Neisseria chenwenguii TaxID=1853278 RepID=A0A220S1K8_9NEIS|nr:MBL fold metallo-hydrolase [Neisseria chenwenguii]ASK27248.1 MBL fold metallo-hydrolase [Neisseria chenwenguii]ROV54807.1 MBL fold metallo-hydrolase [Neisseria chenwenguii]